VKRHTFTVLGGGFVCLLMLGSTSMTQQRPSGAPASSRSNTQAPQATNRPSDGLMTVDVQRQFIAQYCSGCHNDVARTGGMTLTSLNLEHPEQTAELAEKVIKKLGTGLMPPVTASRHPDRATAMSFVKTLETQVDRAAMLHPNPGTRLFQRLTRDEYARSIQQLLGIEIDVDKYLPPDTISEGLDNMADAQAFSASLMEGYMRAAAQVSREALGNPSADPTSAIFKLDRTAAQLRHVDGAPFGTRGGLSIMFNFPADGEYSFRILLHGDTEGHLYGNAPNEKIEVSIDGDRVALLDIDPTLSEETSATGLNLSTERIFVRAGPHRVSAAFPQTHSEIVQDIIAPMEQTLASVDLALDGERTTYPHLREFEIAGPFNVTGVSDNPVRRRVFTCRPVSPADELPCATKIVRDLAREAYRRPLTDEDMEGLMTFYEQGRKQGDFETGIRTALQVILTSPDFLFKLEQLPKTTEPGQNYRVADLALASRLSYFIWGKPPDDELIKTAAQGRLKDPQVFERQVRRLLEDPQSAWLSTKFATEWLQLRDLLSFRPDPYYYPQYDHRLAESMLQEVQLFFDSIVREDRNVLDLLTANYTFVDERLATHYGIPAVRGSRFRRVELTDDYRRGLLGKGAILALTSVADRTSPVQRGKWVMTVLLGTPPPPPPPAVPKLDATPALSSGKLLTVRERMEMHRANPTCASCHRMIDPIGLALENFDVTGQWRTWDKTYALSADGVRIHTQGVPVDANTTLFDGTPLNGPASLRQGILSHSDAFISTLTQKLMAFAIGRRVEYFDMPYVRAIMRDGARDNNRFSALVLGIVKSPAFQMNRAQSDNTAANQ
jgi:hypothetical protein